VRMLGVRMRIADLKKIWLFVLRNIPMGGNLRRGKFSTSACWRGQTRTAPLRPQLLFVSAFSRRPMAIVGHHGELYQA